MPDRIDWIHRVRGAFEGLTEVPDADVIEELAQHAAAVYGHALAEGCTTVEAGDRVAALLDRWRADAETLRRRPLRAPATEPAPGPSHFRLAGVLQDIRYACRLIRRQPRHAWLTVATIALGICATTVLFSVTYAVLMKPLPWPNGDRLIVLKETRGGSPPRFGAFTNAAYLAWAREPTTIAGIAAWTQGMVTLTGRGNPERTRITAATGSLFTVLGARPLIGSFFTQRDESAPVVVLTEGLWRDRFAGDSAVLGRSLEIDGQPHTIVGVLPGRFAFPDRASRAIVPHAVRPATGGELMMFNAIAALRPAATAAQAAAEGTARGRFAPDTKVTTVAIFGNNEPLTVSAEPLRRALTADVREPLTILLVAVALLLAAATANVGALQLARLTTRSREMAIRAAIGAGRARITRQLLAESLVLGQLAGAAGLVLTWAVHRSLPALLPSDFPRVDDLALDAVVFAFALFASVGASIVFGLVPASVVRRLNLVEALAEDGAAPVGTRLRSRTGRARMLVMVGETAIACVLLVGAALLGRSFLALVHADRGYDPADVLSARVSMPEGLFPQPERRFAVVNRILTRLAAAPGVVEAAFTSEIPLTPGGSSSAFEVRRRDGRAVDVQASPRVVSPRYFAALRMRVVDGRGFSEGDTETAPAVVVVNHTFARRYLADAPLGATLPLAMYGIPDAERVQCTVIGVVEDVRYIGAAEPSLPEVYFSYRQLKGNLPVPTVTLLARTVGRGDAAADTLRAAVHETDQRLIAEAVMPLQDRLLATLARPRLYAVLLGGFAGFTLAIAAVGLFGMLSYSVSQRSRELAIRAALGARRKDIVALVLRQGLAVTAAGMIGGLVASLWLARLIASQLFGVAPHDALTFAVVPLLILFCGALASIGPACRAARLDPLQAIRGQ